MVSYIYIYIYIYQRVIITKSYINGYSVKADAFTIDKNNLELAKSLLKFNNNMGSWRLSNTNTDDISYPKHKFILKNEY